MGSLRTSSGRMPRTWGTGFSEVESIWKESECHDEQNAFYGFSSSDPWSLGAPRRAHDRPDFHTMSQDRYSLQNALVHIPQMPTK